MNNKILIGSTFPLNLIRKKVVIMQKGINILKDKLHNSQIFYSNTIKFANDILEFVLIPVIRTCNYK